MIIQKLNLPLYPKIFVLTFKSSSVSFFIDYKKHNVRIISQIIITKKHLYDLNKHLKHFNLPFEFKTVHGPQFSGSEYYHHSKVPIFLRGTRVDLDEIFLINDEPEQHRETFFELIEHFDKLTTIEVHDDYGDAHYIGKYV